MRANRCALLVFLKIPEPGKVKTRLAATIGHERAAALYREWIGIVLRALQPLRTRMEVIGYVDGLPECTGEWHGLADDWWPQPDGDLAARLSAGFEAAHRYNCVVLAVGTDCLELDASLVGGAIDALAQHDAVFGPAADGGYYLVGTARHLPGFFEEIRWSSQQTLSDHLARCGEQGWSVAQLPLRHDIDTWDDYQAYLTRQEVTRDNQR